MAKNTTNLGLYEKESTDGSDTFNIQTMLNDNWDKIDVDSKAKADALTNLAGEGRTAETVKGNADAINALAGEGNTTTVKAVDDALKSHLSDTSSHITSTERATWNAKQAALGYVPVQQGGGTGQLGNKVYIGWDGSKLKAQVDAVDLGRLLTESDYNQLFQFANDGKTGIANAVTAKGVAASPTDTFAALASKIGQIQTGPTFAAGDDCPLCYPDDTDRHFVIATEYTKYKEFKMLYGGTIRVVVKMVAYDSSSKIYGKVYVNGVPRGIEHYTGDPYNGITWSEDISINAGDLVQLYFKQYNNDGYFKDSTGYIHINNSSLIITNL